MTRKSPYHHKVRTYKRRTGKVVHQYQRGHGNKPAERHRMANPKIEKETQSSGTFAVQIAYPDQSPETFVVNASSYDESIENAMNRRRNIAVPFEVRSATR